MSSRLCEHLRKAIKDEAEAGPDYRKMVKEIQDDFGTDENRLFSSVIRELKQDEEAIMEISFDEDRHHDILERFYERVCRK